MSWLGRSDFKDVAKLLDLRREEGHPLGLARQFDVETATSEQEDCILLPMVVELTKIVPPLPDSDSLVVCVPLALQVFCFLVSNASVAQLFGPNVVAALTHIGAVLQVLDHVATCSLPEELSQEVLS